MDILLETEHLKIRKFSIADTQRLYEIHAESEVKKWFPNESYADTEETQGAIEFYVSRVDQKQLPYVLAVECRQTGELIGDTGISLSAGKKDEVEIGYVISNKYSGNGYATELVSAMAKFLRSHFDVKVLYGRVIRGNQASARVLEKSGFTFLGEEFGAEDDPYSNGMLVYRSEIE